MMFHFITKANSVDNLASYVWQEVTRAGAWLFRVDLVSLNLFLELLGRSHKTGTVVLFILYWNENVFLHYSVSKYLLNTYCVKCWIKC